MVPSAISGCVHVFFMTNFEAACRFSYVYFAAFFTYVFVYSFVVETVGMSFVFSAENR